MSWGFGEAISADHRARLIASGAESDAIDEVQLREIIEPLPDWWREMGNALYGSPDLDLPQRLITRLMGLPCGDTVIALASNMTNVVSLLVSGEGATIFVGPDSELTAGEIYCGAGSSMILNGSTTATRCATLDARNGGAVIAARDQLWAANVYIATDDMHRLEDAATGVRLNPFGSTIRLGQHVWLGRDALILGNVEVGDNVVVGARSVLRGQKVASNTTVAGTPARVVREGTTWRVEDLP